MNNPSRLDLGLFFSALEGKKYSIIKLTDFPDYNIGSDIDVFCDNIDDIAREIIYIGNQYCKQGFEIRVKNANASHIHIDFITGYKLDFRFDLYGALPPYKKLRIKGDYFTKIINDSVPINFDRNQKQYQIYVPSDLDDLVLRYIEYIEWYELRPDKIKHLDYITSAISNNKNNAQFLEILHRYTALPCIADDRKNKKQHSKSSLKSYLQRISHKWHLFLKRRRLR